MKSSIEVENRQEADAIKIALADPGVRTCVVIFGTLKPLDPDARKRVLQYVIDRLDIPLG